DVFSYHKGKGIIPTKITDHIHAGNKMVYEVKLRGGRSVSMTKCHNVFVKGEDKEPVEILLKDLIL
ncbi:hypothetical protein LCGC14_2957620, partial [marine sediment metagenome]